MKTANTNRSLSGRAATLAFGLGVAMLSATALSPAQAQSQAQIAIQPSAYGAVRPLSIERNKSLIVDLPAGVAEVVVSQPEIAAAIMRTRTRAIVQGMSSGKTNIFFLDDAGRTIQVLDIAINEAESAVGAALQTALARVLPHSNIRVESVPGLDGSSRVVLTGNVRSGEDRERATAVATQFAGSADNVANILDVAGAQQVMLQVTVSEVKRDVAKQFGINFGAAFNVGTANLLQFATTLVDSESPYGLNARFSDNGNSVLGVIRALEDKGALRVLAQPTLTAISGEEAKFLAGGELPYYSYDPAEGGDGGEGNRLQRTVVFKPYGVELSFEPVVKSNGVIGLKVDTSVSEPQADFSLTKRQASTSVELPSGMTLAIGGLLQESTSQNIKQFPLLGDIPILGALFRSREFQTQQTELVILVTPYLVNAAPAGTLAVPTDKFAMSGDAEAIFLGRIEHQYGVGSTGEFRGGFSGNVGFVLD
ncbi:type II and III secretion system protein family protein [Devosia sp. MC532]|uniref:type II and III secretion system protein family protein n=1 Tax=Devosia sp. MC532 TaxID=2799788 RepID=UPI0018F48AE6|nr:type II and III secretion system protein family protein [Devosia sp. MC532]MBJ7579233.1 type II and III secretion system protein family protein [Devosia sp. MC532]